MSDWIKVKTEGWEDTMYEIKRDMPYIDCPNCGTSNGVIGILLSGEPSKYSDSDVGCWECGSYLELAIRATEVDQ